MLALRLLKLLIIAGFMTVLMAFAFAVVAWNVARFDIFCIEAWRFVLGEINAGRIKLERWHEWALIAGLILSALGWYLGVVRLLSVEWGYVFGMVFGMVFSRTLIPLRRICAIFGGFGRSKGKGKRSVTTAQEQPKLVKDEYDAKRPAARPASAVLHDDMAFIPAEQPTVADLPEPGPVPDIPGYAPEAAPAISHAPVAQVSEEKPAQSDDELPSVKSILAEKGWKNYRSIGLGEYKNCYAMASADGLIVVIDDDKEGEWLADTGELNDQDALWYSETGYRNSPVSFAKRVREQLVEHVGPRAMCFVVETVGVITNTDEMIAVWDSVSGEINVCRADNGRGYPDELKSLADVLPKKGDGESPFEDQIDEIMDDIINDLKG